MKRILIAEDDPEIAQLEQDYLEMNSFESDIASDGQQALKMGLNGGYDLILCGHAHGGQWRLPGLPGGLLAPDEGLFPKYSGGRYDMGGTVLIVSRGLARESTRVPRLYNPPELVIVEIN